LREKKEIRATAQDNKNATKNKASQFQLRQEQDRKREKHGEKDEDSSKTQASVVKTRSQQWREKAELWDWGMEKREGDVCVRETGRPATE